MYRDIDPNVVRLAETVVALLLIRLFQLSEEIFLVVEEHLGRNVCGIKCGVSAGFFSVVVHHGHVCLLCLCFMHIL